HFAPTGVRRVSMRFLIMIFSASLACGACSRDVASASAATDAAAAAPAATSGADAARAEAGWHEVTIPAGTQPPIALATGVAASRSHVEQPVHAHLSRNVVVHGQTALAEGSAISGVVTDATRSGRVKGRAHVAVRFDTLTPRGVDERYNIRTTAV